MSAGVKVSRYHTEKKIVKVIMDNKIVFNVFALTQWIPVAPDSVESKLKVVSVKNHVTIMNAAYDILLSKNKLYSESQTYFTLFSVRNILHLRQVYPSPTLCEDYSYFP